MGPLAYGIGKACMPVGSNAVGDAHVGIGTVPGGPKTCGMPAMGWAKGICGTVGMALAVGEVYMQGLDTPLGGGTKAGLWPTGNPNGFAGGGITFGTGELESPQTPPVAPTLEVLARGGTTTGTWDNPPSLPADGTTGVCAAVPLNKLSVLTFPPKTPPESPASALSNNPDEGSVLLKMSCTRTHASLWCKQGARI